MPDTDEWLTLKLTSLEASVIYASLLQVLENPIIKREYSEVIKQLTQKMNSLLERNLTNETRTATRQ